MEDILGLSSYLQIIYRRKFHFLVSFLTVVSMSFVFTFTLPKIYTSTANILVEKRGDDTVKGIFKPAKINPAKFNTLERIITSRGKVEELIKKLGLERSVSGPIEYENLVQKIQSSLNIKMSGKNIFNISYRGRDPRQCMQIVNTVAGFFVEEDINAMYSADYGESPTLVKLLAYYEERIDKAQGAVTKFKIENRGQLPGSLNRHFRALERAQVRLASLEVKINSILDKKKQIEDSLMGNAKFYLSELENESLGPEEKKLKELTQKLDGLLTRYTEKHPAVIKLRTQIERQKKKLLGIYETKAEETEDAVNIQSHSINPTYIKLQKLLAKTNAQLKKLQARKEKYLKRIETYNERVKNAPTIEQEWAAINRDLLVNKKIYKKLQQKLQASRMRKELDIMEQNIRFTVINPAQLPLNPISPKMSKNLLVGTILGLFLGICSAFWAEFSDHTIRDPKDIQKFIQVPLLATIPTVHTEMETISRKRMMILAFVAGGAYVAFLLLLVARELVITYTPSLLYLQTYKYAIQRFLEALGLL